MVTLLTINFPLSDNYDFCVRTNMRKPGQLQMMKTIWLLYKGNRNQFLNQFKLPYFKSGKLNVTALDTDLSSSPGLWFLKISR